MDSSHLSLSTQATSQDMTQNKRKRDADEDGANQLLTHLNGPAFSDINNTVDVQKLLDVLQSFQANTKTDTSASEWSQAKRSKTEEPMKVDHSPQAEASKELPHLPEGLWQRIFSFVPPVFLGRLLRVSHAFHDCLSSSKGSQLAPLSPSGSLAEPTSAEKVWIASRKRFCPGLPKPLTGLKELDMWRLLRGNKCQLCQKPKHPVYTSDLEKPWDSGPETDSLRFVWPFGLRCCISCLNSICVKELTLRISPTLDCPKDLIPALPFIFMTSSYHYLNIAALGDNRRPPSLSFDKFYLKSHIEMIKTYFEEVKTLGEGSTEEWLKGLPDRGDALLADYTRFENWESKGGLRKVNTRSPSKSNSMSESMKITQGAPGSLASVHSQAAVHGTALRDDDRSLAQHSSLPQQSSAPLYPVQGHQRAERSIQDINEIRATRRAEIERRCAALNPPISPNVLVHMESFQAAMQITQPMTDSAWELLKPRLLAQHARAEKQEREQNMIEDEIGEEDNHSPKESLDPSDKNWEACQTLIRKNLSTIADDYINTKWARGKQITKETAPQFAADLLCHVRRIFYDSVVQQDHAALAAGRPIEYDVPGEPPTRTLILENMKWIYDHKIKPRTDRFQPELFLCAGCPGSYKFYGFEGVVQHFAAKHTSSLSLGNSVVHWRAEWPEEPMYKSDSGLARAVLPGVSQNYGTVTADCGKPVNSGPSPYQYIASIPPRDDGFYSAPNPRYPSHEPPPYMQQNHGSFPPQSNGYGPPPPEYASYLPGPYSHTDFSPGYQPPAYSGPPSAPYYPSHNHYPPQAMPQYSPPPYYGHNGGPPGQYNPTGPPPQYPSTFPPHHRPSVPPVNNSVPQRRAQGSELYAKQLDDMAKFAREMWFATNGIKDIPQSVRIYAVIHHMSLRYAALYQAEPTLAMFQEGLNNDAKMRPVRSLNGIGCNECVIARREADLGHRPAVPVGIGDRRLFTLPLLLNHFRNHHVEPSLANGNLNAPDWKREMIELPELHVISELIDAVGMDDGKLTLLAAAFPAAFPSPLPRVGSSTIPGSANNLLTNGLNNSRSVQQYGNQLGSLVGSAPQRLSDTFTAQSSQPLLQTHGNNRINEAPREDEYDPHRPANLQTIIKSEPNSARLDGPANNIVGGDLLQELSRNLGSYQEKYHKSHISLANRDNDLQQASIRSEPAHPAADNQRHEHGFQVEVQQAKPSPTGKTQYSHRDLSNGDHAMRKFKIEDDTRAHERGLSNSDDAQPYSPKIAINGSQHEDEYRPPSRIEASNLSGNSNSVSPRRPPRYEPQDRDYRHEAGEVRYVHNPYGQDDEPVGIRTSVPRSRSRSPRPAYIIGKSLSPTASQLRNGPRGDSFYRVASPPPREETRSQRLIRYEYDPQDRYAYVEDSRLVEPPPRQRVQYVPIGGERQQPMEHTRYVYTEPNNSRQRPTEYIHYDGAYAGDSIYEHNGQLYRAQAAHEPLGYTRAYRY